MDQIIDKVYNKYPSVRGAIRSHMRRERITRRMFIILMCVVFALGSLKFLGEVLTYKNFDWRMEQLERIALEGRVVWDEEEVKEYNEIKEAKEEYIQENDIARWIYHSAFSVTGKILRALTIFIVCGLFLTSVWVSFQTLVTIFQRITRRRRARTARVARANRSH